MRDAAVNSVWATRLARSRDHRYDGREMSNPRPTAGFDLKPDFEQSYARYEAFWNRGVADRPPVGITLPIPHDPERLPAALTKRYPDHRSRWLDLEGRVERDVWKVEHTRFLGDAMPIVWPNMGPEIFSAWCGAGYEFGETTTWSEPNINDWDRDAPQARLDTEHPLFVATLRYTDMLIERGRGRFIVGLTDFHPGGDHLAALRDPARLAIDLIENPEHVKRQVEIATAEFFHAYDLFYDRIRAAGMPVTSWLPLLTFGRYYIPSNDFSALISPAMFEEFFLDGIRDECRFLDRSIYHLDGPDALRHLDALLEVDELDAIQFVPGAGNEDLARWIPVYQRIQGAGKAMQILDVNVDNLDLLFDNLRPDGVFVGGVGGVRDEETARRVLARFARWTAACA